MRLKIILLSLGILLHSVMARAAEPADSVTAQRNWGRTSLQIAASLGINIGVTEILKHSVHETRPDGSDDNSFPSRHTSWAYNIASIGAHELYQFSPWTVPGLHIVGSAIGMQRVMAHHHHPGDVLAGAAIGIASAEIGYWLGNLVFPGNRTRLPQTYYELHAAFDYETRAVFPLTGLGKGFTTSTGIATQARLACPLGNKFGVVIAARLMSLPVYHNDIYTGVLNACGVSAGGTFGIPLHGRWGLEGEIRAGASRVWGTKSYDHNPWAFDCDATAGFPCRLTDNLSIGPRAGYSFIAVPHAISALTLSLFTQVTF